ncbi:MAG: hypothetical protein PHE88_03795 [Elusimicrobia bacterium]|nr:hypothetical protein [Elusimicrobiota bacterium]
MKEYTFKLICSDRDKNCRYKTLEKYMFYCTKLDQKAKCDGNETKNRLNKLSSSLS